MSEKLEGYKNKYRKLSDSLLKKSSIASLLNGEQKKQKITEIGSGLNEAEALIESMDLEARGLHANMKDTLHAKVREYKSDLKDLKSKVKKIAIANLNPSIRDGLLETGMADTLMTLANQMDSSNAENLDVPLLQDQLDTYETALANPSDSSNIQNIDVPLLQDQQEQMLHDVDDNVSRRKPVKCIIGSILAVLVLIAIIATLYFKGYIKLSK